MHPREVAIIGAVVLLLLVPWLSARDVWRQPRAAWADAGRSRWVWITVVVLVPVLGPVWYLRVARPDVRRGARATDSRHDV